VAQFQIAQRATTAIYPAVARCPGYLAAPGGFDAPKVLGSSATVVREALGGLDGMGRPLGKDDSLGYSGNSVMLLRELPADLRPDLQLEAPLDLVLGAQIGEFSGRACSMRSTTHGPRQSRRPHGHSPAGHGVAVPGQADDFRRHPAGRRSGAAGRAADRAAQ
jgi:hypothetical protein